MKADLGRCARTTRHSWPRDSVGNGRLGAGGAMRVAVALAALLGALPAPRVMAQTAPATIAVLDFDLQDDQRETVPDTTLEPRLTAIRTQLAETLAREHLYTVVDNAPARILIDASRATQDLHACNGCELTIGKALGADRVLVGWVQKVSNLILNINLQIEDVATGRVILNKSVDLRGNTDESWRRGIAYLVRDMVEKNQGGTR
jgi:hypothetical protein